MSFISSLFNRNNKPETTAKDNDKSAVTTNDIPNPVEKPETTGKVQIHNLIIVDESGSMSGLRDVTISGINETINTIREAQKEFGEKQDHFLTLVTFATHRDSVPPIRTIIDGLPISQVSEYNDYYPNGGTPLYDAMGNSLTQLWNRIKDNIDASGVVTVLTDGLENSSRSWNQEELRKLIEQLKEKGWTFSYMGSAHNVKEVTDLLSIDNVLEFSHDSTGASNTWKRESSSKAAYYRKMAYEYDVNASIEEKNARRRRYNNEYYAGRVTPDNIQTLEPNEIFVFGSNPHGMHYGGAARFAVDNFGAQMGVGEGPQGQAFAIPTTESLELTGQAVHRFCIYAHQHPEQRFLVTMIGCGVAGYTPFDIAPLFKEAVRLENVSLPQEFWEVLGLRFL